MPNPTLTPCPPRRRPTTTKTTAATQNHSKNHYDSSSKRPSKTTTPPTTRETTRSSSEKETPTVIFTKTQSPRFVLKARSPEKEEDYSSDDDDECDPSSSPDEPLTHQQAATNMLQTTLECGIASICRLRRLFPRHFFSKMDVQGTSVTRFDVGVLEGCLVVSENGECETGDSEVGETTKKRSIAAKREMTTLSPLTATQKTNRSLVRDGGNDGTNDNDTHVRENDARQAMEALLLLRWIGTNGVHSILKEKKLARVILGVMVPKKEADELVEQYEFEFGCNSPSQPHTQLGLTQARQNMSTFFQNLNGYSAGRPSLSQAVVPMMTQGTSCSKSCSTMPSQLFELQTQQSFDGHCEDTDDESCDKSRHFKQPQKQHASQRGIDSSNNPCPSQKSIVTSMTQSIKASVKRNRGIRIPPSRFLTLRVEFTESIATSDLPAAWRDKNDHYCSQSNKCVSPVPAKSGFVITPLGIVAEENCTGLSVSMTAFSKGRMSSDAGCAMRHLSQQSTKSSQFEIDEVVSNGEESFNPFTQMDFEQNTEDTEADRNTSHKNKALKRTHNEMDNPSPTKQSRCVSPNESKYLPPGTKAFGIPYGNNGSQMYLKCIVRDHRLGPMGGEQYKVEFLQVSGLEKKKQWIPARKVMPLSDMKRRIESASEKFGGECIEEMVESVAEEVRVCPAFVKTVFRRR